jgi:hypothetical protein
MWLATGQVNFPDLPGILSLLLTRKQHSLPVERNSGISGDRKPWDQTMTAACVLKEYGRVGAEPVGAMDPP